MENKRAKKRSMAVEVWQRLVKNKMAMLGLAILVLLALCAIFADVIADYETKVVAQNIANRLKGPSAEHWFGTDEFGRDIFARMVHGSRVSLVVGLISVSVSLVAGGTLGAFAGFYGGRVDNVIISGTPGFARIVRAAVMSVKDQEFVEASRAIGASNATIIFREIIPNCLAPIIVQSTLSVASAILSTASLSFIGLGVQPPDPEWGAMLSSGRNFLRDAVHLTLFPGLAIVVTILALNLLGDGLRDALDPRLKQ